MRLGVGLMKNCGAMAKIVPVPDLVSCQDMDVKCKRPLHRNPGAARVFMMLNFLAFLLGGG